MIKTNSQILNERKGPNIFMRNQNINQINRISNRWVIKLYIMIKYVNNIYIAFFVSLPFLIPMLKKINNQLIIKLTSEAGKTKIKESFYNCHLSFSLMLNIKLKPVQQ